ncbi:MAG: serine--tRNA ligase [Acholeplasmatales bacterium]|jgi:seryl-tRNA synthetase|nr:serine--tRNA ligase [Acholeplasmatales bacterium]
MLDIKYIVENKEEVKKILSNRNGDYSFIDTIVEKYNQRKVNLLEVEQAKSQRNNLSKEIGLYKRTGQDATELMNKVSALADQIATIDNVVLLLEKEIFDLMSIVPNLPDSSVPIGVDETFNRVVRTYLNPPIFSFPIKDHVDLGQNLGILDFERAGKITGTRFVIDKGLGARLERSLIQFMMDLHSTKHGYTEIIPPYIVNEKSMFSTGQFPKFKDQAFHLEGTDYYLNPTAEVPVINSLRDEIIDGNLLPLKYVGYTTAFRSEAGSAGRDTRGILRQHQFNKVELIKFTKPEDGPKELELMLKDAEKVLKLLELPYRVVCLSTGDLGFNAIKTYDIEVWVPSQNTYREISSVSSDGDFQARRASIRFKRTKEAKTEFVHTLNGSGLAIGRTMIAIIENYQNADGTITVPKVLRKYLKTAIIK